MDIKSNHVQDTEEARGMSAIEEKQIRAREWLERSTKNIARTPVIRDGSYGSKGSMGYLGQHLPIGERQSKYDNAISFNDLNYSDRSIEDIRSREQSTVAQLRNNIFNGAVIAGTVFADSFAGTVAGAFNAAFGDEGTALERFVNNPTTLWLNSVQKWAKSVAPTYASDQYREDMANGKWYRHFGDAAFWGETIIENAGYVVGMAGAGNLTSMGMRTLLKTAQRSDILRKAIATATKAGKLEGNVDDLYTAALKGDVSLAELGLKGELANAAKSINNKNAWTRTVAATVSASGEARLEGVHSSEEFVEKNMNLLHSPEGIAELSEKTSATFIAREGRKPTADEYRVEFAKNLQEAEQAIKDAGGKVAASTFIINLPILTASGLFQFGKTWAKGYDTQKGFWNRTKAAFANVEDTGLKGTNRLITDATGKLVFRSNAMDKAKTAFKYMSNPFTEANEEMMQAAASTTGKKIGEERLETLLGYKLDPEAEQTQIGFFNKLFNSVAETYGDFGNYVEGFAGAFMGSTGSLNFTFSKDASGKRRVFQGGVAEDIRDVLQQNKELKENAEAYNKMMADPTFKTRYQNMVATAALNRDKMKAMERGDKFTYYDKEHQQTIQNIITADKVGKLDSLLNNIDLEIDTYSTTDKKEIANLAQALKDIGKSNKVDTDLYANMTDEEIVDNVKKANIQLKDDIKSYRGIVSNLQSIIGDKFSKEDDFNEMVYLFSHIDNHEKRFKDLQGSLMDSLKDFSEFNKKKYDFNIKGEKESLSLQELLERVNKDTIIADMLTLPEDSKFKINEILNEALGDLVGQAVATHSKLAQLRKESPASENQRLDQWQEAFAQRERELTKEYEAISKQLEVLEDMYEEYYALSKKKRKEVPLSEKRKTRHALEALSDDTTFQADAIQERLDRLKILQNEVKEGRIAANKKANERLKTWEFLQQIEKDLENQTTNASTITSDLEDVIKIQNARHKLLNTYNSYTNNPALLTKKLDDIKEEAEVAQNNIKNETIIDELNNAQTHQEAEAIIEREREKGNKDIDDIVHQMGADGDPVIRSINRINGLIAEILNTKKYKEATDVVKSGVRQLLGNTKDKVASYEEFIAYTITQADLDVLGSPSIIYTQEEKLTIQEIINDAIKGVSDMDFKYEGVKVDVSKTSDENEDTTPVSTAASEEEIPTGLTSFQEVKKENDEIQKKIDDKNVEVTDSDKAWNDGINLIDIDYYNATKEIRDVPTEDTPIEIGTYSKSEAPFIFIETVEDSLPYKSSDFSGTPSVKVLQYNEDGTGEVFINGDLAVPQGNLRFINAPFKVTFATAPIKKNKEYNVAASFLKSKGADKYKDSGKVKRGTKVKFLALQEYWDYLIENGSSREWVEENKPLLLVVEDANGTESIGGKNYQIIGTFKNTLNPSLHESVLSQGVGTVSNESTTVINVTPGRVAYNTEKPLSSLQGKDPMGEDVEVLLGIVDHTGQVNTNMGEEVEVFNVSPKSEYPNVGRVYILTKGASGQYIPSAVRVKTLKEVDVETDTPLFNELRAILRSMVNNALINSKDDSINDDIKRLRNILYVGSKSGKRINIKSTTADKAVHYFIEVKDDKGYRKEIVFKTIHNEEGKAEFTINSDAETIYSELLEALKSINAPFQVNKNFINTKWNVNTSLNYNEDVLLPAGILTTNLATNYVRGAYVVMNPINSKGEEIKVDNTKPSKENNSPSGTTPLGTVESPTGQAISTPIGTVTINNKGEVKEQGANVTSTRKEDIAYATAYIQSLPKDELAKITFKGTEVFTRGLDTFDDYYLLPDGRTFNGSEVFGVSTVYTRAVNAANNRRNSSKKGKEDTSSSTTTTNEGSVNDAVGSTPTTTSVESSPKTERRRPTTGGMLLEIDNSAEESIPQLTEEELRKEIEMTKGYQIDNCNGIIDFL